MTDDAMHIAPLAISPELRAAYESTDYEVALAGATHVLRIGERTPSALCAHEPAWRRLVVISAYNPFSRELPQQANEARHAALVAHVDRAGRAHAPALGRDPSGRWPAEVSLAVFDPTDDEVDAWMVLFEQNAVVLAERGATSTLRFHPDEANRRHQDPAAAARARARVEGRRRL
ncbi:MAG: DUF3293 domain-containing protein [Planctomycetota bacterium]